MGKFCQEVKIGYAVRGERGEKLEPGKIIMRKRGVNFGFFVLLSETKSKMPIFLAS